MADWVLDQKLADDSIFVADWPLSQLRLINDSRFPWLVLVPRVSNIEEIFQLSSYDQQRLLQESSHLAKMLSDLFKADKMNVAALGNVVRQLHVHHIVRYVGDCCYPSPVWGVGESVSYTEQELRLCLEMLHDSLAVI
jgi:diadenosine tetraphosphate (Ap4A) HIT family hydrolase